MPHHDKLNGLFSPAPGICLPGLCLSLLVLLSQAWPVTAQEQAPVDDASELAGLDIATELSSLVSAAQVNALNWLRFGGDPDTVVDEDGNTVMHYAAAHPYLDILQEAVRLGGHCNRRNAYGATPLHFAASKGTDATQTAAQAVRILARCEAVAGVRRACAADGPAEDQCRADPDAQDRRGNTPLHTLYEGLESTRGLAGRGEANAAVQRALLAVDADPNVKNHAGDTPLMPAIRYQGVMFTKPEHVSELLRHDADPDTRNKRGDTPLIETVSLDTNAIDAEDDPVRIITSLLKHGADPDRRAGVGAGNSDTPLIRAARHEDDSVHEIEALLAGGADPCLRDRHGRLAYDHAADGSAGQQALYDAGGYPDPDTGLCVRDLRQAEEQEHQLSLDQETRQRIQSCLKSAGFDPGAQDGQFAPDTRAAIRAWQQAQGREGIEAAGYFAEGEADVLLEMCGDTGAGAGIGQTALERELAGEMVSIPAGTFRMGDLSGAGWDYEKPVRSVTVPAFKLGKYEVTYAQWDACVADGGCNGYTPGDGGWGSGNRPVSNVSWDDAQSFIRWLNSKTGGNYRLPTEAEWEYAARSGSTTEYSWGDDLGSNRANCDNDYCGDSWDYTAPVGSFPANPWGLHDMHGNVWEWAQDCWNDSYEGAPTDGSAWTSGDCSQRVFRGGAWGYSAGGLRSADRFGGVRTGRFHYGNGFRLAQDE